MKRWRGMGQWGGREMYLMIVFHSPYSSFPLLPPSPPEREGGGGGGKNKDRKEGEREGKRRGRRGKGKRKKVW